MYATALLPADKQEWSLRISTKEDESLARHAAWDLCASVWCPDTDQAGVGSIVVAIGVYLSTG